MSEHLFDFILQTVWKFHQWSCCLSFWLAAVSAAGCLNGHAHQPAEQNGAEPTGGGDSSSTQQSSQLETTSFCSSEEDSGGRSVTHTQSFSVFYPPSILIYNEYWLWIKICLTEKHVEECSVVFCALGRVCIQPQLPPPIRGQSSRYVAWEAKPRVLDLQEYHSVKWLWTYLMYPLCQL